MRVRATVLVFLRLRACAVPTVSWKPMHPTTARGLTSYIIDPISTKNIEINIISARASLFFSFIVRRKWFGAQQRSLIFSLMEAIGKEFDLVEFNFKDYFRIFKIQFSYFFWAPKKIYNQKTFAYAYFITL